LAGRPSCLASAHIVVCYLFRAAGVEGLVKLEDVRCIKRRSKYVMHLCSRLWLHVTIDGAFGRQLDLPRKKSVSVDGGLNS